MADINGATFFITGGAGFIGSNLVEALLRDGAEVIVYDNLSSGNYDFIRKFEGKGMHFIKGDILDEKLLASSMRGEIDTVVHFAANPNIKLGNMNPVEQGLTTTYNVLEAARVADVKNTIFSSSGSVYGIAKIKPTPEDYGPLKPISIYGAMKLGSEGMVSAFSNLYGSNFYIFRFANVIGKNATHGVVFDFINKLKKDKSTLQVLGNGSQRKSYLSVDDCIGGILHVYSKSNELENIFNIASDDQISVREIAEMVVEHAAKGAKIVYGSTPQGWPGDIADNFISNKKIKEYGYTPRYTSREAVQRTIDAILSRS